MTEPNMQPARPLAPSPSLEDQFRKAVEDSRAQPKEAVPRRPTAMRPELGMPYGGGNYGGVSPVPTAPMPTGAYIAGRLGRTLDRLRTVESYAGSIAVTLAGPGAATSTGRNAAEQPPAASLFVIYDRTLDEIDRIIDNIESEQARTRNILSD